ncbi:MAG: hypothetical protein Q7S86_01095 [bacterium]|nr:hypothetical protein [bacterium]
MNSDLPFIPLEVAAPRSFGLATLSRARLLTGFIPLEAESRCEPSRPLTGQVTPVRHSFLRPSVASGEGGSGGGNEKNQTLLDIPAGRFRVFIKDTRFFDVRVYDLTG